MRNSIQNPINSKIRAVIVDDENHARESLARMLTEHCPNIEIAGIEGIPISAIKMIDELNPDLLFLDIRLSNTTGFDLLGKLRSRHFGIIFVTAYDHYAIKAIKFSAVDYLLKPVDPIELINAVRKFTNKVETERRTIQLELLIENLSNERAFSRLGVNTENRIELLLVKEIVRLQGESNYTRFHMENGKTTLVSKSLVEFEELLGDLGFIRVHKTHVVNKAFVSSVEKQDNVRLLLMDGTEIPVSRRRKVHVVESMSRYNF